MDLPTLPEKLIFEFLGFKLNNRRCIAETKDKKRCKLKKLRNGGLFCYVHEVKTKNGLAERICTTCDLLGSKIKKKEEQIAYNEWKRQVRLEREAREIERLHEFYNLNYEYSYFFHGDHRI